MARRSAPPWFELLLGAACACAARALVSDQADAAPLSLGFFGFLIALAGWVWEGVQFIGQIALSSLAYSVGLLWSTFRTLFGGFIELGRDLFKGFKAAWGFLKDLYVDVLKPAWSKFWKFIDWARTTLERVFRPVMDFLRAVRRYVLDIYDRFVRPVLDTIDIIQRALRVLASVGVEWAAKLDDYLTKLEEKIQAPFQFMLRELNKVINFVNRIATADGLFQRLALVRSIERDIRYVSRAFMNWRSEPLTEQKYEQMRGRASARTIDDVKRDTEEALLTGGGRYGPLIEEMRIQWSTYLGVR